jgi:RNA polymerase sigma-70 factor (ECF subfamily)
MNVDVERDFSAFFSQERERLLQMSWAITLDREQARDVVQETMARAWSRWDELGVEPANPAAWCRTVALNLIRSQWRRDRTERAAPRSAVPAVELAPEDRDLIRALHRLSDRQRTAVALHHLADLSVARVAELMEISESSVKEHLQRGRSRLEAELGAASPPAPPARDDNEQMEVPR